MKWVDWAVKPQHKQIFCYYQMLHIYSVLLLHLQIAKYKGFLIKIKVFIGFSAKLKILKDFNKIKGFKGSCTKYSNIFS